jgi:hypothetical protein
VILILLLLTGSKKSAAALFFISRRNIMTRYHIVFATLFACSVAPFSRDRRPCGSRATRNCWYQEDSTPQAQLRTLRKEISAALAEARKACRSEPSATRATCLKEAQDTYRQDMANAEKLREAAHPQ